jgi:hypothetical protein
MKPLICALLLCSVAFPRERERERGRVPKSIRGTDLPTCDVEAKELHPACEYQYCETVVRGLKAEDGPEWTIEDCLVRFALWREGDYAREQRLLRSLRGE